MEPDTLARLTGQRRDAEIAAKITDAEIAGLTRKLNAVRLLLRLAFPRGFGLKLGERHLHYDTRRGLLGDCAAGDCGDFVLEVPTLTIKEALRNNHLTDLGITISCASGSAAKGSTRERLTRFLCCSSSRITATSPASARFCAGSGAG